jgi:hypothetical protein
LTVVLNACESLGGEKVVQPSDSCFGMRPG